MAELLIQMPDVFSPSKRSEVMARIRSSENKATELLLIKIFSQHRIVGWRRHWPLYGKPDFVFPHHRIAVFVDGCFWHGCPRCYRRPKSHRGYWDLKVTRNRLRDRKVGQFLRSAAWQVIRFWQHELENKPRSCIQRIKTALAKKRLLTSTS